MSDYSKDGRKPGSGGNFAFFQRSGRYNPKPSGDRRFRTEDEIRVRCDFTLVALETKTGRYGMLRMHGCHVRTDRQRQTLSCLFRLYTPAGLSEKMFFCGDDPSFFGNYANGTSPKGLEVNARDAISAEPDQWQRYLAQEMNSGRNKIVPQDKWRLKHPRSDMADALFHESTTHLDELVAGLERKDASRARSWLASFPAGFASAARKQTHIWSSTLVTSINWEVYNSTAPSEARIFYCGRPGNGKVRRP